MKQEKKIGSDGGRVVGVGVLPQVGERCGSWQDDQGKVFPKR